MLSGAKNESFYNVRSVSVCRRFSLVEKPLASGRNQVVAGWNVQLSNDSWPIVGKNVFSFLVWCLVAWPWSYSRKRGTVIKTSIVFIVPFLFYVSLRPPNRDAKLARLRAPTRLTRLISLIAAHRLTFLKSIRHTRSLACCSDTVYCFIIAIVIFGDPSLVSFLKVDYVVALNFPVRGKRASAIVLMTRRVSIEHNPRQPSLEHTAHYSWFLLL